MFAMIGLFFAKKFGLGISKAFVKWLLVAAVFVAIVGAIAGAVNLVEHGQKIALNEAKQAAQAAITQQVIAAQAKAAAELAQKQADLHKSLEAGSQLDKKGWDKIEQMLPADLPPVAAPETAPSVGAGLDTSKWKSTPEKGKKADVKTKKRAASPRSTARDLNRTHRAATRLLSDDTRS